MDANWLWILVFLLVAIGIAGSVLPALPGLTFVFAGLVLAAWIDDFQRVGWVTLAVLGIMTALAMALDIMAGLLGAKRVGASKLALVGAAVGALVGLFFGLLGIFLGPFVGAFVGEYIERGKFGDAGKIGLSTWLGLVFGALLKIATIVVMLAVFVFAWVLNR